MDYRQEIVDELQWLRWNLTIGQTWKDDKLKNWSHLKRYCWLQDELARYDREKDQLLMFERLERALPFAQMNPEAREQAIMAWYGELDDQFRLEMMSERER